MNTNFEDIASIAPTEKTVEILHPGTNEKLGITVTVMSVDDPRLKSAQRQLADLRMERERRGKPMNSEETERRVLALLAKTITGWNWGERKFNGETPEFSEKKVIEIMVALPWFFTQLNDEIGDTKAFFQR